MPSGDQRRAFQRPAAGIRKVVLATNLAETAITIDDVVYVVDTGRVKEKSYDPHTAVSTLQQVIHLEKFIEKESDATQRFSDAGGSGSFCLCVFPYLTENSTYGIGQS